MGYSLQLARNDGENLWHSLQYVQFCIWKRKFKGTVPWDFWLQVFSWISFSQAPEYPEVHHRCRRWHQGQIYHRCHWYQWQLATGVIDTSRKFDTAANLTPAANLTLVANLQRWAQMFFLNSQIANPQTLRLNLQSQIRKFLKYASSQISYLRIFFDWSANRKFANFVGDPVC